MNEMETFLKLKKKLSHYINLISEYISEKLSIKYKVNVSPRYDSHSVFWFDCNNATTKFVVTITTEILDKNHKPFVSVLDFNHNGIREDQVKLYVQKLIDNFYHSQDSI